MVKAYVDASPTKACVVFEEECGSRCEVVELSGENTNNEAEYLAVTYALVRAHELGVFLEEIFHDSQLVVRQLTGEYKIREKRFERFAIAIWDTIGTKYQRLGKFLRVTRPGIVKFTWVPREENKAGRMLEFGRLE